MHRNGTGTGTESKWKVKYHVETFTLDRDWVQDPFFPIIPVPFPVLVPVPFPCRVHKPLLWYDISVSLRAYTICELGQMLHFRNLCTISMFITIDNSRKQHYYNYTSDIIQGCSFLVNTTHLVQQRAPNCQTLACFLLAAISTTLVAYPSDDPCYATNLISPGRPSSEDQCQQSLLPWSRLMSPDNGLVSCHRLLLFPVENR